MDCKYHLTNVSFLEKNYNIWEIPSLSVCDKLLRSRLEDIQKLKPPMTVKGCRRVVRTVNFLSLFCPELQNLWKPIYDLTRKGRQFIWGEEQQITFDKIKRRLVKPPALHLSDTQ